MKVRVTEAPLAARTMLVMTGCGTHRAGHAVGQAEHVEAAVGRRDIGHGGVQHQIGALGDIIVSDVIRGVVVAAAGDGSRPVLEDQVIDDGRAIGECQQRRPYGVIGPLADVEAEFIVLAGLQAGERELLRAAGTRACSRIREPAEATPGCRRR